MTIKIKGTPKEITAFAVEMRQRKNKMPTVRIEDCVFRAISQNLQKAGCDSTQISSRYSTEEQECVQSIALDLNTNFTKTAVFCKVRRKNEPNLLILPPH